jgi:hypothetical protein
MKSMKSFKKKSRLKQAAKAFENELSRNEWILYLFLIDKSDKQSLQVSISLRQLHRQLKMAINTIKACRKRLQAAGLLSYYQKEYETTIYEIRDLTQNPLKEIPNIHDANKEPVRTDDSQAHYLDFDYSFADETVRASFTMYIKHRLENGIVFDQKKLEHFYDNLIQSIGIENVKPWCSDQIFSEEYHKLINRYKLDFVEPDVLELLQDLIWKYARKGEPLSQREVESLYQQVFIDCEGNVGRMTRMLNEILNTK